MTRIIQADCVEAMREMDEASVDAIVTDPPYGISFMGKAWDGADITALARNREEAWERRENKGGGPSSTTIGSPAAAAGTYDQSLTGSRAFQKWSQAWATEALRVLKPGGHLLVFGGTRTYHRLACAIEDAGFEIRDSVIWLYGSGFPKSLDVSKAIDKAAGATPIDLGESPNWRETKRYREKDGSMEVRGENAGRITAPATPEAQQWQGWGTALKPAHEPIVVARKPLAGTVAANVLEHGTGALNIDGTRIGTDENTARERAIVRDTAAPFGRGAEMGGDGSPLGRWPANVALSHLPECKQVGTRRVKGSAPASGPTLSATESVAHGDYSGERGEVPSYQDQEIPAYSCAPGCAVRELDLQSGERPGFSGGGPKAGTEKFPGVYGDGMMGGENNYYGDTGGASRFFYTAKASRAERNAGLDGFEERRGGGLQGTHDQSMLTGSGNERNPFAQNAHPTVKPIDLMRWLVRLVTPPEGTILDPFCGSGTTGIAAVLEGFDFIGIEREAEYAEIARARIDFWAQYPGADTGAVLKSDARAIEATGQIGMFEASLPQQEGER